MRNRLRGTFLVNDMTAAEFAFQTIMGRKGVRLKWIGKNGTRFALNGTTYRPDFHCVGTRTYYEVAGTRQAYHANKEKYAMFRATYPNLTLKVVRPDGQEIQIP